MSRSLPHTCTASNPEQETSHGVQARRDARSQSDIWWKMCGTETSTVCRNTQREISGGVTGSFRSFWMMSPCVDGGTQGRRRDAEKRLKTDKKRQHEERREGGDMEVGTGGGAGRESESMGQSISAPPTPFPPGHHCIKGRWGGGQAG